MKGGTVRRWGREWVAIVGITDANPHGNRAPHDWYAWHEVRMYQIIEEILHNQGRAGIISGYTDKNIENIFNSIIDSADLLWSSQSSDALRREYILCLQRAIAGRKRHGMAVRDRSTKDPESHEDFIKKEEQILDRLQHYHEYKARELAEETRQKTQDAAALNTPDQIEKARYRKILIQYQRGDASVLDELNAYRISHGNPPLSLEPVDTRGRRGLPTTDPQQDKRHFAVLNKEGNDFGFDPDDFPEGVNSYGWGGKKRKSRKNRKLKKYTKRTVLYKKPNTYSK